jgi:malonyl-CoA/methylmalonyl-CoA synthetase
MRVFISGSAPLLLTPRPVRPAHRPHHPGALRHERDGDADVEPYDAQGARGAAARPAPAPGVELRVVGGDGSAPPTGGVGATRCGPNVFAGYWRMPGRRARNSPPTAERIGDVGRIDDDGYLSIVGRSKDLIISGGYNVYPAEIGRAQRPAGIAESAVVACHRDAGEAVVAVVVARAGVALDTAADAGVEGQDRQLPVPAIFVVAELPRNAMARCRRTWCASATRPCSPDRHERSARTRP